MKNLGWIVLTYQTDGSLRPDWDGELHTSFGQAVDEWKAAGGAQGAVLVQAVAVSA